MSGLMPLEKFDCERDPNNIGEQWKKWKRGLNIYLEAANIEEPKKKRATLLHLGGLALQDIFYSIPGAHEDSNKVDVYQVALRKLDEYFYLKQTQHTQSQNNIVTEQEPADDDSEWVQETVEEYFTQDEDSNDPEDSINHQGDPLQNIEVNRTIKLEEVDKPSSNESDSVDNVPTARAATRSRSEECPYPNEVKRKKFDNSMNQKIRPSFPQVKTLISFLEANPEVAKGHLRTNQARWETKRKWQEITKILNAMGCAEKDYKGWSKFWTDKKYALKKMMGQRKADASRTGGGGSASLPSLTPIDKRMLALLGGRGFAEGNSQLVFTVPILPSQGPSTTTRSPQLISEQGSPDNTGHLTSTQPSLRRIPRIQSRCNRHRFRPTIDRGGRSQVQIESDRLLMLEEKRVQAELVHARALQEHMAGLSAACNNIAEAISTFGTNLVNALQNFHSHPNENL